MNTLVDGRPDQAVPADDRGLLFGEHVFETIAFWHGQAPLWSGHMQRLARGAEVLGVMLPDPAQLARDCRILLQACPDCSAVIRITITAGSGGRGYWPVAQPRSRRIVQRRPWPSDLEDQRRSGLRAIFSAHRLADEGVLAGLKHGNRLLQTLAARECARAGADEAVLLDSAGRLAEAVSSNLVLVGADGIATPPQPAVAGVGLAWLREELASELAESSVFPAELDAVSELLVINSIGGIRPVTQLGRFRFEAGPVFRRLHTLWQSKLF